MGLDAVELVLEIEDRYAVRLLDAECEQVRTVSDLVALVLAKLPLATGSCASARTFYELRRQLSGGIGASVERLRPGTPLTDIFPLVGRVASWREVGRRIGRVPPLTLSEDMARRFGAIGSALMIAWMILVTCLVLSVSTAGIAAAFAALFCGAIVFERLRARQAIHFPIGIATLGDLVQCVTPRELPAPAAQRLAVERRVIDEVCACGGSTVRAA